MAKIQNIERLQGKLNDRLAKARRDGNPVVVVGYAAAYALYVHENMEIWPPGMRLRGKPRPKGRGMYWDPQGRAGPKFLEKPFRRLKPEFIRIINAAVRAGKSLAMGLVMAGLRLQRESMQMVPVDSGNLRASAFTRRER